MSARRVAAPVSRTGQCRHGLHGPVRSLHAAHEEIDETGICGTVSMNFDTTRERKTARGGTQVSINEEEHSQLQAKEHTQPQGDSNKHALCIRFQT